MEIPDFSGLPEIAQGVLYTVTGLAIGASILVTRLGFLQGKTTTPNTGQTSSPTLAAVIVDPAALNNHANKLDMLARSIDGLAKVVDEGREEMRVQAARRSTGN